MELDLVAEHSRQLGQVRRTDRDQQPELRQFRDRRSKLIEESPS